MHIYWSHNIACTTEIIRCDLPHIFSFVHTHTLYVAAFHFITNLLLMLCSMKTQTVKELNFQHDGHAGGYWKPVCFRHCNRGRWHGGSYKKKSCWRQSLSDQPSAHPASAWSGLWFCGDQIHCKCAPSFIAPGHRFWCGMSEVKILSLSTAAFLFSFLSTCMLF